MEYTRTYSIRKGEYFADALKRAGKEFIPTNCIINKLLPGLGATHCELIAPRKSIIIELMCLSSNQKLKNIRMH